MALIIIISNITMVIEKLNVLMRNSIITSHIPKMDNWTSCFEL